MRARLELSTIGFRSHLVSSKQLMQVSATIIYSHNRWGPTNNWSSTPVRRWCMKTLRFIRQPGARMCFYYCSKISKCVNMYCNTSHIILLIGYIVNTSHIILSIGYIVNTSHIILSIGYIVIICVDLINRTSWKTVENYHIQYHTHGRRSGLYCCEITLLG